MSDKKTNLFYNSYEFRNLLHFAGSKIGLSPVNQKVQNLAFQSHQIVRCLEVFANSSLTVGAPIVLFGVARQFLGFACRSETVSSYLLPAAVIGTVIGLVLANHPLTRKSAKKAESSLYKTLEDRFNRAADLLSKPEAAHFSK